MRLLIVVSPPIRAVLTWDLLGLILRVMHMSRKCTRSHLYVFTHAQIFRNKINKINGIHVFIVFVLIR